jgi:DivIVA domain-containing protein
MRRKNETRTDSDAEPSSASHLTPGDVQNKEFGLSFRGYNERDVDEFLDRVTEDLAWYIDENRKLRSQLASSGYIDPKEWGANAEAAADDLLTRAKQEADRIVREAQARASSIGATTSTDHRSIVGPYLNRERDFLQSLGGLVKEHAETIKAMVEEARARVDGESSRTEAADEGEEETRASPAESPAEEPSPAPIVITDEAIAERSEGSGSLGDRAVLGSSGDPTRGDGDDDDQRRSMRELFWGDD